jgi:DNA-3-methyladenine glycosylase
VKQLEKLPPAFYDRSDVVAIARELLGHWLVTAFDGRLTIAAIVETEAYAGTTDRASHAYNNRRTARTEVMFGPAGHAYVYLCYGIHSLFNIVTHREGIPHAVLIRAAEPVEGEEWMLQRTGKKKGDRSLTRGPGNLARAMGLQVAHSGYSLQSGELYVARASFSKPAQILSTPRIGVEYAEADALLPYRFIVANNPYVSGPKTKLP